MRALVVFGCLLCTVSSPSVRAAAKRQLEGVVNVNAASPDELQLLPGIGPAKVRNIVAYRTKHPFRTVEELVRIKGIGRKMYRRLRLHLAVSGPTTAQQVIRAEPAAPAPPEPPPLLRRPVPALPPRPGPPLALRRGEPRARPIPYPAADANHCLRKP
jgi:competence protein ComEA